MEEVFEISTEVLEYMPFVVGVGMACSCLVVLTAGLLVSCFKEALIKSTCADLRQKFLLARKKTAGILTDFKIF